MLLSEACPGCETEADRRAVLIHDGKDPGAQSTKGPAGGVSLAPSLPPAACMGVALP